MFLFFGSPTGRSTCLSSHIAPASQVSFAVCDIQRPGALRDLLRPSDLVVGLHPCGSLGEDGTRQGAMELVDVPNEWWRFRLCPIGKGLKAYDML